MFHDEEKAVLSSAARILLEAGADPNCRMLSQGQGLNDIFN
jgi:hypothetical protein